MNINPNIVPFLDAGIFPAMQSSGSYMNPQKIVQSETRSTAKASILSYNSVHAWSPPPSLWPSNAAPTTSTPSNPTEQFQDLGQTATWGTEPVPDSYLDDDWLLEMELFDRYPEEDVLAETRYATASAPPCSSVVAGYSQQSTWSSHVAPPISTQYNSMEQIQAFAQLMAVRSVVSSLEVRIMRSGLFPGIQLSGSYMNPPEVVESDTRCAMTTSAPPKWPQPLVLSSNTTPPNFTQKPMEQFQNNRQTTLSSPTSAFQAFMVPSSSYMHPPEVVESETSHVARAEQNEKLDPGNGERKKWQRYDERTVSTLKKHYLENRYPSSAKKEDLANQTELTIKQVDTWFTARRHRDRTTVKRTYKPYEQEAQTTLDHLTGVAPTENSENVDPVAQSKDFRQASTSTMVDGNLLGVAKHPSNLRKMKDERTLSILRKHYLEDPYLAPAKRMDLANQTGLTPMQVADWFAGRRRKERKAEKMPKKKYHNKLTVSTLRKHYLQGPYLSLTRKKKLAEQTGLTPKQVNRWFINRRRSDWVAEVKKIEQNGNVIDAINRHSVESAPSKDSESVDFNSQMIAPEDLQMPMQLQMAPTHDRTGVMQNPPKPLSPKIYDYSINDVKEW